MSDNKICFCQAREVDIAGMAKIEGEFFSDYEKAFDEAFFAKWYAHNPDMFFVIKDMEGEVFGFVILTPVTEDLHRKLIRGEIFDFFDFDTAEVCRTMDSDYYYISDICITKRKKCNYFEASTSIIGGATAILVEKAKFITACPVTVAGVKMCRTIGMQKVAEADCDGKKYTICMLEATPEKIVHFQRLVNRINRLRG